MFNLSCHLLYLALCRSNCVVCVSSNCNITKEITPFMSRMRYFNNREVLIIQLRNLLNTNRIIGEPHFISKCPNAQTIFLIARPRAYVSRFPPKCHLKRVGNFQFDFRKFHGCFLPLILLIFVRFS